MQKRKVLYTLVSLLILSAFGLLTWQLLFPESSLKLIPEKDSSKTYSIQVVLKARNASPDFWRIVEQGIDVAAEECDIEYEVNGPPAEIDIDTQIQMVRNAIAKKPDAIILAASDYEKLVPVCKEAFEAGIPVIMLDSNVNYDKAVTLVSTDNYEIGRKLADLLGNYIGEDDRFGVVGHFPYTTTAVGRSTGLLENTPNSDERLVALEYCDGKVEIAKEKATKMLLENPDIKAMVGLNEASSLGIAYALTELGLEGQIPLIACDSSTAQIKYMENGTVPACVVQNPFNMGYLSMQAAVQHLQGKSLPDFIDTASVIVTREEMYKPEYQKLLFPFTDS
ncbi:MAG: substrate-binding domain-containing protein [Oscillospiraceae bacterium]